MITRFTISKIIALVVGLLCLLIAFNYNTKNSFSINGTAYGTSWSITASEFIADHHHKNIIKIINNIDMVASNYKSDSEVSVINDNAVTTEFVISDHLYKILTIAKEVHNQSDGLYDITLGKLSSKMGFSPNFNDDLFHTSNNKFLLQNPNKLTKSTKDWFDLSSIAKGYSVQLIHEYLLENNLNNHLIDIGGEVIINGSIHGKPWKVGIQDPSSFIDKPIYVINNLDNKFLSIATSGEYRNFKILDDGKKITHTINPKTLSSISSKVSSVTVVHQSSATYADAYATAFNVMGETKAINFANENDIAVMLTFTNEEGTNLKFSKKWYDLKL